MNTKHRILSVFLLIFTLALAFTAFGQSNDLSDLSTLAGTNSPPGTNAVVLPTTPNAVDLASSLVMLLISVVAPMLVRLGVQFVPKAPVWILPILAPVLVAVANWISAIAGGPSINPLLALLLGSAGVGLREVQDQVRRRMADGPVNTPKVGLLLFFALAIGLTACGTFRPVSVKPGADPILVHAEYTVENAAGVFNQFFDWERQHEKTNSAVHAFAESLRSTRQKPGIAAQGLLDLRSATETYRVDRSPEKGGQAKAATVFVFDLANTSLKAMGRPPLVLPAIPPSIHSQLNAPTNGPPANP
jgi:hypothetical protein